MTREEALNNIGQSFRPIDPGSLPGKFDTIREVQEDGTIIGDIIEMHHDDCRLKQSQPEQLKKLKHEQGELGISTGSGASIQPGGRINDEA